MQVAAWSSHSRVSLAAERLGLWSKLVDTKTISTEAGKLAKSGRALRIEGMPFAVIVKTQFITDLYECDASSFSIKASKSPEYQKHILSHRHRMPLIFIIGP
ncbi:hypothetical protein NDU88_003441 [Pleurodeles waltl]|uniref:Uncharacterized protein n=1 Tax=Pleurodeles waltl TaxID=8319 RepID=A0AAV7W640_PLEWA|nr:hypothetical protein NDU88_003441 [Pleurodeles waltl]